MLPRDGDVMTEILLPGLAAANTLPLDLHRFAYSMMPCLPGSAVSGWGAQLPSRLIFFGKQPSNPHTPAVLTMDSAATSCNLHRPLRVEALFLVHHSWPVAAQLLVTCLSPLRAGLAKSPTSPVPLCPKPLPFPVPPHVGRTC